MKLDVIKNSLLILKKIIKLIYTRKKKSMAFY